MPYYSSNSNYQIPPPSKRSAAQAPPYPSKTSRRIGKSSKDSDNPCRSSKHPASSLKLPMISLNLVSLVSKFEALDSLSLPFRVPSLKPAPLKQLQNSLDSNDRTHQGRLSTMFSSRSGGQSYYKAFFPNDTKASEHDDPFISAPKLECDSIKFLGSGKPRQAQSPSKPSPILLRDNAQEHKRPSLLEKFGSFSGTRALGQMERKRKSTVKDRIRFFDGSTDDFIPTHTPQLSSTAHVTPSSTDWPSQITETRSKIQAPPVTPQSRRTKAGSTISGTRGIKSKMESTKNTSSHPPKKSFPSSQKCAGSNQPMPTSFLAQCSGSKSAIQSSLPQTSATTRSQPKNPATQPDIPAFRGLQSHQNSSIERKIAQRSKKEEISPSDNRGRSKILSTVTGDGTDTGRRRISDKFDALYCAKSKEKEQYPDYPRGREKAVPSNIRTQRDVFGPSYAVAQHDSSKMWQRESKIADLKMLFDKQPNDADFHRQQTLYQANRVSPKVSSVEKAGRALLTPSPPLLSPSKVSRASAEPGEFISKRGPSLNYFGTGDQRSLPGAKSSKSSQKSRNIGDKIKLFESTPMIKGHVEPKLKADNASRTIGNSTVRMRKKMFETEGRDAEDVKAKDEGLSVQDIDDIVAEFRNIDSIAKRGKRNTTVGRWNIPPPPSQDLDGPAVEMIVKEAECLLKEPKPMRLVEMKRMIWLCREKPGVSLYKERVGSRHQRKL